MEHWNIIAWSSNTPSCVSDMCMIVRSGEWPRTRTLQQTAVQRIPGWWKRKKVNSSKVNKVSVTIKKILWKDTAEKELLEKDQSAIQTTRWTGGETMGFMLLGSEVRTTGETSRINTSGTVGPPLILRSFSVNNRNIEQEGGGLYVYPCSAQTLWCFHSDRGH